MSLTTPDKIRTLQRKLYLKAKAEPNFRFYLLYDKVYRADILRHAYDLARANKGAPGVDGVDFAAIEAAGLESWLDGIETELRTETYRPQPVRRVMIPKPGGGERPLGIPTIRDRVVQTAAKLVLEPIFEADLEPTAYGYETVRNLGGILSPSVGLIWPDQGNWRGRMEWRVVLELSGAAVGRQVHEVHTGRVGETGFSAATLGLSLAEAKAMLSNLQRHLVQAQTEEHCQARRHCPRCDGQRPLKDRRGRRLNSLFGAVEVQAPRFGPCRCSVTLCTTTSPATEIMPDRCTPEFERVLAKLGALLPYRRARALLEEFFPVGDPPTIDTIQQRTIQVGARLEREAIAASATAPTAEAETITLAIDSGHVRAVRSHQARTFEVFVAQASNDDGKPIVFGSVPVEADRQTQQLRAVLHRLGETSATEVTILSDGADGPRSLGEAASVGAVSHVLDWFHLGMRIQHVAQTVKGWPAGTEEDRHDAGRLADAVEHVRWRLWHGQVERALDLIGETLATLDATAAASSPSAMKARKLAGLLRGLETYVVGQTATIIDYATARRCEEPISTAPTESTVQWLLHRRMGANQQMRWSPKGAHLMLKVRTSLANGTFDRDHVVAERWARRPFRRAA